MSWSSLLDVNVFFSLVHPHCEGSSIGGGGDSPSYPVPLHLEGVGGQLAACQSLVLILDVIKHTAYLPIVIILPSTSSPSPKQAGRSAPSPLSAFWQ